MGDCVVLSSRKIELLSQFFNALDYQKENNLEIKSILEYLINRNSTNDFTNEINQQVEKLKYDERFKGEYMMVNLHEWELTERAKKQGWEEGKIEVAEQTKIETAKNLLKEGLSVEQIARCTNLSLEKIQELAKV